MTKCETKTFAPKTGILFQNYLIFYANIIMTNSPSASAFVEPAPQDLRLAENLLFALGYQRQGGSFSSQLLVIPKAVKMLFSFMLSLQFILSLQFFLELFKEC